MADENDTADKTEDPTQKRLDDAHDHGDVAKSQEINTWFVIAAGTLLLSKFSGSIGGGIVMPLRNLVANSWMIHADGPGLMALAKSLEYVLIAVLGVPLLMLHWRRLPATWCSTALAYQYFPNNRNGLS